MNPASRSRRLAAAVASDLGGSDGVEVDFVDLQENVLPLCDGGESYGHPGVQAITERLGGADAFVVATPIYNYAVNSALKNLTEHAGDQMSGKLVGFLCSAGGAMSYMALMQYANSLMLDFRVIILPRFVYANGKDWTGDILSPKVQERLEQFEKDFLTLAGKLTS